MRSKTRMAEKVYTDTELCLKCFDENEVLYDDNTGKYMQKIHSTVLDCPQHLYPEVLRNLEQCKQVVFMSIKQRTIMNESRVRFYARNDIAGLQAKIADVCLSKECRDYLRDISLVGYQMLKDEHFFNYLVEFDTERLANVQVFGKKVKLIGYFDMLALMDEMPRSTSKSPPTKVQYPSRKKLTKDDAMEDVQTDSNFQDIDEITVSDTNSEFTVTSRSLGKAVLTVIVTARNHINATDVFRQIVFSYLQTVSKFYFLVFHIGPLTEKQEVVLYEYKPPKSIMKLVKSFQTHAEQNKPTEPKENQEAKFTEFIVSQTVKTSKFLTGSLSEESQEISESHDLDVSQLETEFRKVKGRYLKQVSPLRDYFRYMVYDCPGVKDHERDKKARYDRYTVKRERKREQKKRTKAEKEAKYSDELKEPKETQGSYKAEFGSESRGQS